MQAWPSWLFRRKLSQRAFVVSALLLLFVLLPFSFAQQKEETAFNSVTPSFSVTKLPVLLNPALTPQKRIIETMSGGLAIGDWNLDGRLDLFFCNGADPKTLRQSDAPQNQLPTNPDQPAEKHLPFTQQPSKTDQKFWNRALIQNADGTFADATQSLLLQGESHDIAAAPADFDNDGDTDLFVAGVGGGRLYRHDRIGGKSRFHVVLQTKASVSVGAVWFDFDNDGDLDLFVVNYLEWNPTTEPFCGDSVRQLRTYCHPREYAPAANQLFENQGFGKWREVSFKLGEHAGKGMAAAVLDLDDDRDLDLIVTNDTLPNFVFQNRGNTTFVESGVEFGLALNDDAKPVSSMGVAVGDYNGDLKPDVLITALSNETYPLFRQGKRFFRDVTNESRLARATLGLSGWGVVWLDVDRDGHLDLVTANGDVQDNTEQFSGRASRQPLSWFRNVDGKTFDRARHFPVPVSQWRGLAAVDLNQDGAEDLVATRLGDSPVILWGRPGGKSISVDATRLSDADLAGSYFILELDNGKKLRREITFSGSYASGWHTKRFLVWLPTDSANVTAAWLQSANRDRLSGRVDKNVISFNK
jgi:enediyne biosynthesis protein E4